MVVAKVVNKIPYGARLTKEKLLLYIAVACSFLCIAIANGTPSWLIKDWFKDDVFGDEYRGLWKVDKFFDLFSCKGQGSKIILAAGNIYQIRDHEPLSSHFVWTYSSLPAEKPAVTFFIPW